MSPGAEASGSLGRVSADDAGPTVLTFVVTDIEGSTRRWESHPAEMAADLARHDAILRGALMRAGGTVVGTAGDAFHATFVDAGAAIRAALEIQRSLLRTDWGPAGPLQVRVAIHAGEVQLRTGGSAGPGISRAERLGALGHGGQILVSRAAAELARDRLPEGASLRPLGQHRLAESARPIEVFQLVSADLPDRFPPLRSPASPATNLPGQLSSFVGRKHELGAARQLLRAHRLVTFTGPAGAGKTRLALQLAGAVAADFPDGVWFVELDQVRDPDLVLPAITAAVGIREEPARPLEDTLAATLRDRRTLLLLDSCEHVLEVSAALVDRLLRATVELRVLVTSREALALAGEAQLPVPPLPIPAAALTGTDDLAGNEAIRLFVERATAVQPRFALTDRTAPVVARIVSSLDGIPLAIELAAARIRVLSVDQLADRLDDRFRILTASGHSGPAHHQTLRAAIDWSHDLLGPDDRVLFRRLAVFAGGWTIDGLEPVTAGPPIAAGDEIDVLSRLVERSLVAVDWASEDGAARYRYLQTIRQYALERLAEAGERESVAGRHAAWMLAMARDGEIGLRGRDQAAWLIRLEDEHDNLRAALDTDAQQGDVLAELALVAALGPFWRTRGYLVEGRARADAAVGRAGAREHRHERDEALITAGSLAYNGADYPAARAYLDEAIVSADEAGDAEIAAIGRVQRALVGYDAGEIEPALELALAGLAGLRTFDRPWETAWALNTAGNLELIRGRPVIARDHYAESLEIRRRIGDLGGIAASLSNLALVERDLGESERASDLFEEAVTLQRTIGDRQRQAILVHNLGLAAFDRDDLATAERCVGEANELARAVGDAAEIANSLADLAAIAWAAGDGQKAVQRATEAVRVATEIGAMGMVALALEVVAGIVATGDPARAARLWAAADRLREETSYRLLAADRRRMDRSIEAARTTLGEVAWSIAWAEGREADLDHAIEDALATSRPPEAAAAEARDAADTAGTTGDAGLRDPRGTNGRRVTAR